MKINALLQEHTVSLHNSDGTALGSDCPFFVSLKGSTLIHAKKYFAKKGFFQQVCDSHIIARES